MKILIADSFPQLQANQLTAAGHTLSINPSLEGISLTEAISDHEILIVRSTKVTSQTLDNGRSLKLVIRSGAGTNTIDKAHARAKGISVSNVPGANSLAVAELVMGLIIVIDRHIADCAADCRSGIWNKKAYSAARGLCGQKIGILGLGAIGLAVAERAKAFGMTVHAVAKPGRSEAAKKGISEHGIMELESQDAMLEVCDIITLHMPANNSTRKMVNTEFLAKMKHGAMLINTSRGELVDEPALLEALENRGIRAGMDVYDNEPGAGENSFVSTLAKHPSVCGTHHIGASTAQAQTAVADGVLAVIQSYINGSLINGVN